MYILAKNLSTCFKRTERATGWLLLPVPSDAIQNEKKTSNCFYFNGEIIKESSSFQDPIVYILMEKLE